MTSIGVQKIIVLKMVYGKIIGKLKNVNFEKKNIENFKHSVTNELHGAIGYLSKLEL